MYATTEDREYAWRHAFAYADAHVSTEDAVAYANHYARVIEGEDDPSYWPGHGETFAKWHYDS